MSKRGSKNKKSVRRTKTGLPVFDSDEDFMASFEYHSEDTEGNVGKKESSSESKGQNSTFQDASSCSEPSQRQENLPEEDFKTLLDQYFTSRKMIRPAPPKKIPLKKRLKRYPPPEVDLDLHGMTAITAEQRTLNFIHGCKQRGFFTVRIIVGKGLHSEYGAVLPDLIKDLLARLKADGGPVLHYERDRKKPSASGAFVVYIRQFERFDE